MAETKRPARTAVASILVGVFVLFGTGVLCDLATRLLPTHVEHATIVGRDTHETILPDLATGTRTFASSYRIVMAGEDGARFTIDAPKALYDRSLPGLMMATGASVKLRRSALFGKPVGLEVIERPLVDLSRFPALGELLGGAERRSPSKVTTYDLRLPHILSVGWLTLLGIVIWGLIRAPRKEEFVWPLFIGAMVVSVALGVWWWAA